MFCLNPTSLSHQPVNVQIHIKHTHTVEKEKKRKEKTTTVGVSLMRSPYYTGLLRYTRTVHLYAYFKLKGFSPAYVADGRAKASTVANQSIKMLSAATCIACKNLPKALHVSLLNIAVLCDVVQRMQVVSLSRLMIASAPCS